MKCLACVLCLTAVAMAAPDVVVRVRDGETKQPLAGAIVLSEGSDVMVATDSSGRCQVVVAPRKGGALVASRPGYLDRALTGAWPAKQGQDTVVIDFLLYPNRPKAVVGAVIDAGTKVAVPGPIVSVEGSVPAEPTGADGGSGRGDSSAGPRKVEASHAEEPSMAVLVEAERTGAAEANLSLVDTANAGSVEGVVSDVRTGLPVRDAKVAVEGTELRAATDSTGSYVIESVPAGVHKLLVTCSGYITAYTVVRLVKDWAVTVNLHLRETASESAPGK